MINFLKENKIKKITWDFPKKEDINRRILSWEMFSDCNYNCSKCFQNSYRNKSIINFKEIDKLIYNSKKVYDLYKINNFRRIEIIGGEITLLSSENLIKILSIFENEKNLIINLYSNFSREENYFFPIIDKFCNLKRLELTLSFHEEKISLNEYVKKLNKLLEYTKNKQNVKVIMQFTVNANNIKLLNQLYKIYNVYKQLYNISMSIHEELIMNNKHEIISSFNIYNEKNIKLNEELLSFFNRNKKYEICYKNNSIKKSLLPRDSISFNGCKCFTDAYTINFFGNLTDICCNHIYIKNFYEKEPIVLPENSICSSNFCCCSFFKVEE